MAKQVKSKQRVEDHGEVFTAEREVNAMCDLVEDECRRIDSRFLEPACGDGNFLDEILKRKLDIVAKKYKKSPYDYERNALLALGSLYGVDIMLDNVVTCRQRLFKTWENYYKSAIKKKDRNNEVCESALFILTKNIICGNALSLHCVDDNQNDTENPIVFSKWSFATGPLIKREEYTFEELLNRQKDTNEQLRIKSEDDEGTLVKIYPPIHYRRLSANE